MPERLLFAQNCFFLEKEHSNFDLNLCHVMTFYALQVSYEKIYNTLAQELDEFFGQDWRKRHLRLWENDWNTWRVQKTCVFIVQKFLTVSAGPGCKILGEWIWCRYLNVINRLLVATSQSINNRREHMLRLDISQLALIRVLIVH